MAGEASPPAPPEIPTRCHHCAGPLSKDMVRVIPLPPPHHSSSSPPRDLSPWSCRLRCRSRGWLETSSWTVPPLVRDSFSMIGSAIGGTAGAFYGFNHSTSSYCLLFCMCWVSRWDNTSACTAGIIILSLSHSVVLLCPHNFS
uniref:Uncharacterized protein n=2 Tax=Oryza TaxID=4527 RepID=A0A0E0FJR5_ORYNI